MTDREKQIRAERLARGWDDPYGDRRLRGASYAEAKAAARVSARQTARDLGALGADLARGVNGGRKSVAWTKAAVEKWTLPGAGEVEGRSAAGAGGHADGGDEKSPHGA